MIINNSMYVLYVCMSTCYSVPSRFLLRGAPDYSADTESEFHAEAHEQLRVKDLPWVPIYAAACEPATLRLQGTEHTPTPPRPTMLGDTPVSAPLCLVIPRSALH